MDLSISEITSDEEYEGSVSPSSDVEGCIADDMRGNPVWYKLRFTFSNQEELTCLEDNIFMNRCRTIHRRLAEKVKQYSIKQTTGFEILDKKGDTCKAHVHIHFESTHMNIKSMRRTFVRLLGEKGYGEETYGNKHLSLVRNTELQKSEYEFFGYAIKQGNYKFGSQKGFTKDEIEKMYEIGHATWLKVVQVNQQKDKKRDNEDTLFERLKSAFKKSGVNTTRSLQKEAIRFYIKEKRPLNHTTISGYVANYMISEGYMTEDEYIDRYLH